MPMKLTSEQRASIKQVPHEHSLGELVQYLDEAGLNSQGSIGELIRRVQLGDDGAYHQDVFKARFDPAKVALPQAESTTDTGDTVSLAGLAEVPEGSATDAVAFGEPGDEDTSVDG